MRNTPRWGRFNPTMVRLLPAAYYRRKRQTEHSFNPTMVRLLLTKERAPATKQHSFNPTMVRLLLIRNGI